MKLSVRETETIIKILTPAYCPITKASSNSPLLLSFFCSLFSQPTPVILSLFVTFSLEIKNNCVQSHYTYHEDSKTCRPLNKVEPWWALFCGIRTWMGDQKRIPRVVITSLFFHSFSKVILRLQNSPALCDVMSLLLFLNYLFLSSPCPHSRVYVQYRTIVQINSQTRRSNSSQFSWLLVV